MRFLLAILFAALLSACQQSPSPEERLAVSTIALAQPLYRQLAHELTLMQESVESYCQTPGDFQQQDKIKSQWKAVMFSWQAASIIHFGPITIGSVNWKFQFWPDRRNLVKTKVDEALLENGEWNIARIGNTSIAARGVAATEYLIFERLKQDLPSQEYCDYLKTAVADMKRNSQRVSRHWQHGENRYSSELLALARFKADRSSETLPVTSLLVDALYVELEQTYRKLTLPLGKDNKVNSRYLAESWRSRTSFKNLQVSLNSLKNLFLGGVGYGLDDRLSEQGSEGVELTRKVIQALDDINETLSGFQKPLFDMLSHPAGRNDVYELAKQVKALQDLLKKEVPNLLDLPTLSS